MNKYDKSHLRHLAQYEKEVEEIYKEATKEAAKIGASVKGFDPTKPFTFADYPQTKKKIDALMKKIHADTLAVVQKGINEEWGLSNNKNDALCNTVFAAYVSDLPENLYNTYYNPNDAARKAFIDRTVQGLNLSDRVWKYTTQYKNEMEMALDLGIRDGKSADALSRDLRGYLQHPDKLFRRVRDEHGQLHLSKRAAEYHPGRGVYRSSYKNARRLAATECNIAYRSADHERWQNLDFVVGVRVVMSNNHTCKGSDGKAHPFVDICDELSAPLGSTYTKGRGCYPKGFKFTGWHPHCRCHAESILKTDEENTEDLQRILKGEQPTKAEDSKNAVTELPDEFKKWMGDNAERLGAAKNKPYFVKDNTKYCEPLMKKGEGEG